jgi:D-sedoheptulose 7-phosphate isomerase
MSFERIQENIMESIAVKRQILDDEVIQKGILDAALMCIQSLKENNKILFCGNGGSAADAQHLAAELSGRYLKDRDPLYAEALHVNTSYLTAVANDYGFEEIFARHLRGIGRAGDVLIALSTSGNSENVIRAVTVAQSLRMRTVAFTGESAVRLQNLTDVVIQVPSQSTPRIQEAHITIGHIICELIENAIFGANA